LFSNIFMACILFNLLQLHYPIPFFHESSLILHLFFIAIILRLLAPSCALMHLQIQVSITNKSQYFATIEDTMNASAKENTILSVLLRSDSYLDRWPSAVGGLQYSVVHWSIERASVAKSRGTRHDIHTINCVTLNSRRSHYFTRQPICITQHIAEAQCHDIGMWI